MNKPIVFLIAAITADGFIAQSADHFADWTSKEDKQKFVELTKDAGVMVMGSKTFAMFPAPLKDRKHYVYTRQPTASSDEMVIYTSAAPKQLIDQIANQGYKKIAIIGGQQVYDLFLSADAIDEVYLTVEPALFGAGIALARQPMNITMELLETTQLNASTVMLHYRVVK